jgi:23S rRNA (adenine2503-C2)-methyltransferase
MRQRPNLKDYSIEGLRERLARDGHQPYRADQIAGWLYQRGVDDFERMTDLAVPLRARLDESWETRALSVAGLERSRDGTLKAVLRARDGAEIESVLIPEEDRTTLCISTQVGCAMACGFCATGSLGFRRNLSTAEIIDQVCRMREAVEEDRRITNIVFMGMGEPLLNLSAVVEAVRILIHPKAFAMAPRRVTVSTVGIVPKIEELLTAVPVNLAVSLHATTDAVRERLVPIGRRFPLAVLLGRLRELDSITPRRPVFFEYTLIAGLNDSEEDARRLAPLLAGIPSKVNLIPMNPHADSPLRPPSEEVIDRFLRIVAAAGMLVTLRRPRGEDIDAACGQLALRRRHAPAGAAGSIDRLASAAGQPPRTGPGDPVTAGSSAGSPAPKN